MFSRVAAIVAAASLIAGALSGCSSDDQPTTQASLPPTTAPAVATRSAASEKSPILEESLEWSFDEALANLQEPDSGLSAALRLVRLAELDIPSLPEPLPAAAADRLRLIALSDSMYALGAVTPASDRRLLNPVLISAAGQVIVPDPAAMPKGDTEEGSDETGGRRDPSRFDLRVAVARANNKSRYGRNWPSADASEASASSGAGAETRKEPQVVLHLSKDGDVFPHLLIWPDSVRLAVRHEAPAVTLRSPPDLHFELRDEDGYSYLALALPRSASAVGSDDATDGQNAARAAEAARYKWDPFEETFHGPAMDKLPDPPGGKFQLDMKKSLLLQPVGGEIPPPDPIEKPDPRERPDEPL